MQALGEASLYEELDLYGQSADEVYQKLSEYYSIYTKIGGYPAVVLRYLENRSIEDANAELLKIIKLFTNESKRYFNDSHIRNRKARFLTSRALLDTVPTGL